jgi:hypothetical protein
MCSTIHSIPTDNSHFVHSGISNLILSEVHSLSLSCFFCQSADLFPGHLRRAKFWHKEFVKANQDRLFGSWFKTLDGNQSGVKNATVDGLVSNLSHSIVKAVEIKGKRFRGAA